MQARVGLAGSSRTSEMRGLTTLVWGIIDGGRHEARDRFVGTSSWVRGRQHRRGPGSGLLPVHQLSCRLRHTTWRRTAAAASRACRRDPGRRCARCRSATGNANEPWRSGQSCGQALRELVVMCPAELSPLVSFASWFQTDWACSAHIEHETPQMQETERRR